MTPSLLLAVLLTAAVVSWPPRRSSARRLTTVFGSRSDSADPRSVRPALTVIAVVAVTAVVMTGLPPWLAVGLALGYIVSRQRAPTEPSLMHEVPLLADLFACCLAAGATVPDALDAAATTGGGLLAARANVVTSALRRGAAADDAWRTWLDDPLLAPLARPCVRTSASGAAVSAEIARVAARMRSRRRAELQQRTARAGVWVVLPVGACFLPAFVLVGVVPVALGLLRTI